MADITGTIGNDSLPGTSVDDTIRGLDGNDTIEGLDGNDSLDAGNGFDSVTGGLGADTIIGFGNNDTLFGEEGDDSILGGGGRDSADGGVGFDWLEGGGGDDTLSGGADNDVVGGGAGNDRLFGGLGNDTLVASGGRDTVDGGDGDDSIDAGNDGLADSIIGGLGNDTISRFGRGGDTADAGDGDDFVFVDLIDSSVSTLTLGAGADTVQLRVSATTGRVVITDFQAAPGGDLVNLAGVLTALSVWDGTSNPFLATQGFLRLRQDGADVVFDVDINGGGDAFIEKARFQSTLLQDFEGAFTPAFSVSPPAIGGDRAIVVAPGGSAVITPADLVENDPDDSGAALTWTASNVVGGHLALAGAPGVAITIFSNADLEAGNVLFVHDGSPARTGGFEIVLTDDSGGTSGAPQTVTATFNTAPLAADDSFAGSEDSPSIAGNLLADNGAGADADAESDALVVSAVNGLPASVGAQVTLASGALLTVNADGTFSYDPNGQFDHLGEGASDVDAFVYTISDGFGGFSSATVSFSLAGVNDAPVAKDDAVGTDENTALLGDAFADNGQGLDADVDDGDAISVTAVNGQSANVGTQIALASGALLTLNADGTFAYDPNGAFNSLGQGQLGADSFTYEISDGHGGVSSATVAVTITGLAPIATAGPDLLIGSSSADTIDGLAGDDTINGLALGDQLFGNAGDDVIDGGEGSDNIDGGDGADLILGQSGRDTVAGGIGNDSIDASAGDDSLDGGANNDSLVGGTGIDRLVGNNGNDTIQGGLDSDTILGGKGFDYLLGQDGADSIEGGELADTLSGGNQNDILRGGAENDLIFGNAQRDLIFGDDGDDIIDAGTGDDTVDGGGQKDRIFGGSGADSIIGGGGNDILQGGNDADTLLGGAAFDVLEGGDGDDSLAGGDSNDVIFGNAGNDTIVFNLGDDTDTVRDFTAGAGVGDVIRLVGFGAAFDTFAEVLAAATDDGLHTTINLGGGDVLILRGVLVSQLAADDFIYG